MLFKRFLNWSNATSIWIWDPSKHLENRFLGTFKSCDSVGNDFYFIFVKLCVFTKMGLGNDRYRLQKGPKKPFCGCFGPNLLKLVKAESSACCGNVWRPGMGFL